MFHKKMSSYFHGESNIRSKVTLGFSPGTSSLILFSYCCLLFSPKSSRIPQKASFKTQSSTTDSRQEFRILYLQYQAQMETTILNLNLFVLHPDQCKSIKTRNRRSQLFSLLKLSILWISSISSSVISY